MTVARCRQHRRLAFVGSGDPTLAFADLQARAFFLTENSVQSVRLTDYREGCRQWPVRWHSAWLPAPANTMRSSTSRFAHAGYRHSRHLKKEMCRRVRLSCGDDRLPFDVAQVDLGLFGRSALPGTWYPHAHVSLFECALADPATWRPQGFSPALAADSKGIGATSRTHIRTVRRPLCRSIGTRCSLLVPRACISAVNSLTPSSRSR